MPNGNTTFLRVRKTKWQKFIMRTKNLDNCAPLGGSENRNKRGGGRPNRKTTVPASFKQGRRRVSKSRGTGGKERSEKTKSRLMRRRFTQKTNKGICFVCHEKQKKAKKTNMFTRFLGESAAGQSAFGFI